MKIIAVGCGSDVSEANLRKIAGREGHHYMFAGIEQFNEYIQEEGTFKDLCGKEIGIETEIDKQIDR